MHPVDTDTAAAICNKNTTTNNIIDTCLRYTTLPNLQFLCFRLSFQIMYFLQQRNCILTILITTIKAGKTFIIAGMSQESGTTIIPWHSCKVLQLRPCTVGKKAYKCLNWKTMLSTLFESLNMALKHFSFSVTMRQKVMFCTVCPLLHQIPCHSHSLQYIQRVKQHY